jgi:NhaP-type Na+/H+ or K+/H+ antiporter
MTADIPPRDPILAVAFGIVRFTLVVQGLTLPLVTHWARVARRV